MLAAEVERHITQLQLLLVLAAPEAVVMAVIELRQMELLEVLVLLTQVEVEAVVVVQVAARPLVVPVALA
jgi:hypothetical protein